MKKPSVCLWFNNNAEEAVKYYASIFRNSKIGGKTFYGPSSAEVSGQPEGSLLTIELELEGLQIEAMNGGPLFQFSPATSMFVSCESEAEINTLWSKLSTGGVLMELQKYPWSERYGWCQDQFGVSWQLILGKNDQKIMPAFLFVNEFFGKGKKAVEFYTSLIPNSKVKNIHEDPETKTILHGVFSLNGQDFALMEGKGEHPIKMSMATSFVLKCDNQEEIDLYWDQLSKGGEPSQCGWLTDQFGVTWQVTPAALYDFNRDDPARNERVMSALLEMTKLNLAELKKAYEGK